MQTSDSPWQTSSVVCCDSWFDTDIR